MRGSGLGLDAFPGLSYLCAEGHYKTGSGMSKLRWCQRELHRAQRGQSQL